MSQNKYVLAMETLCGDEVIASWTQEEGGIDAPTLFDTEADAYKDIADDMITELQQFIDGERSLDDTDFGTELYPKMVTVLEDGTIQDPFENNKVLFDPKDRKSTRLNSSHITISY